MPAATVATELQARDTSSSDELTAERYGDGGGAQKII